MAHSASLHTHRATASAGSSSSTGRAGEAVNSPSPESGGLSREDADHNAATMAQAAFEHLCRAWSFQREPILRDAAKVERITAAVQLRQALEYLEQAA